MILLSLSVGSAKAGHGCILTRLPSKDNDTLNFLVSAGNKFYYYDSPLADDKSNFKLTPPRFAEGIIRLFRTEAKANGDSLVVTIKIQEENSLNEISRKAIELISKQPGYQKMELTAWEKRLLELTEKP